MFTHFRRLYIPLCIYSISVLSADVPGDDIIPSFPVLDSMDASSHSASEEAAAQKATSQGPTELSVNPFTGKVKGRKVRVRVRPELDSQVVKELTKNDLVLIVGEKGDFWAVEAPSDTKAYIFRSFILENVVEGSHVNVRLEPSLDAPVIGHMNSGDHLSHSKIAASNPKWFEISPPASARFYIAKDYIDYAGGPEIKQQMEKRQEMAEQLLDSSLLAAKSEIKKSFDEIDFDRVMKGYHTIVDDFSDFPDLAEQAKESLATFQEEYLQKRISYLEKHQTPEQVAKASQSPVTSELLAAMTDRMRLWQPIEEALYYSWANINDNKSLNDYYEEQKLAAVEIEGFVEPYNTPVKNRPGDFILREKDIPVAYVYSTQINLQNLVGTHVKMVATQRPNNNFAFPAYYILRAD